MQRNVLENSRKCVRHSSEKCDPRPSIYNSNLLEMDLCRYKIGPFNLAKNSGNSVQSHNIKYQNVDIL